MNYYNDLVNHSIDIKTFKKDLEGFYIDIKYSNNTKKISIIKGLINLSNSLLIYIEKKDAKNTKEELKKILSILKVIEKEGFFDIFEEDIKNNRIIEKKYKINNEELKTIEQNSIKEEKYFNELLEKSMNDLDK